ncbi:sodium/hydrogen exchanger 9B2-like [Physella acuta]|uniref:sodium/hydrogen exchanger 9B2-like n=1 Tax=Physella acuta TaxID=109671 RepID=UPI0027DE882D|nr:sodium/hydrogen exchanger 9B2-like [Physella acuta]
MGPHKTGCLVPTCIHACHTRVSAAAHPLPRDASCLRKLLHGCLCPPSGKVGAVLMVVLMFSLGWAALWSVTKKEVLPNGSLYPVFILFVCSWCGGYLVKQTPFPPLIGMLIVGFVLKNVTYIDIAEKINPQWSSNARSMALTVILTRAGLSLDPGALRRLSFVVLRLAFLPSVCELVVDSVMARVLLGLPWTWAFMLGFVMSVVSPAVVVPSMLSLSQRGYGLDKGIPTLILAACSLDSVLAITGFGVLLGVNFSKGDVVWNSLKGPVEVIAGVCYGCVVGVLLWYIPQRSSQSRVFFRSAMLVSAGLVAIFGSKAIDWSGSGPIGCLAVAFVAGYRWRQEYQGLKNPVEDVMSALWMVFMPLLFSFIGAAVSVQNLKSVTVGYGVAILFAGLATRLLVAGLSVLRTDLNMRERIFVPLAWIPKATVQAAIGGVAYDTAVEQGKPDLVILGKQVLTIAVLAILIAAPIGSLLIALMGPRLLRKKEMLDQSDDQTTSGGSDTSKVQVDQVSLDVTLSMDNLAAMDDKHEPSELVVPSEFVKVPSELAVPSEFVKVPSEFVKVSSERAALPSAPDIVSVPSAPEIVAVSSAPDIVAVPSAPEIVAVPSAPEIVAVPSAPDIVAVPSAPEIVDVPWELELLHESPQLQLVGGTTGHLDLTERKPGSSATPGETLLWRL